MPDPNRTPNLGLVYSGDSGMNFNVAKIDAAIGAMPSAADIAALQAAVTTLQGQVSTLQSQVTALDVRVTALENAAP